MIAALPDAEWQHRARLSDLLDALDASQGSARFVGGAVRDTLLGHVVADVDIATVHSPQDVVRRLTYAAIKAVPTGIDHGTITAVLDGWPVEITTLRRDVATDGRRATIAYTDDWREDAARRDFTINALLADPVTGEITDYFGGLADLEAGTVRFIGDPEARIAEDHLRILRFFRFYARFGKGAPDAAAYAACIAQSNSLMALSRERIADELLKLLALPDPVPALRLMVEGKILLPVLPEIDGAGVGRLETLTQRESAARVGFSPLRRLCALLPSDPTVGDSVAARLKLSNKARKRIVSALSPHAAKAEAKQLAYWLGTESAIDQLLLDGEVPSDSIVPLREWTPPALPITGGALIARGLPAGPDVARALKDVELAWVESGFADGEPMDAIIDQTLSKFQRARQ